MRLNCNQLSMLIFMHIIIVDKYWLKFPKLIHIERTFESCKELFHLFFIRKGSLVQVRE